MFSRNYFKQAHDFKNKTYQVLRKNWTPWDLCFSSYFIKMLSKPSVYWFPEEAYP